MISGLRTSGAYSLCSRRSLSASTESRSRGCAQWFVTPVQGSHGTPQNGAFAALRDRNRSDPAYDHRPQRSLTELYGRVEARRNGTPNAESLMLAWSFSTTSRQSSLGRFERIRDRVLRTTSKRGPEHGNNEGSR